MHRRASIFIRLAAAAAALGLTGAAAALGPIDNLTGLPAYPNLNRAAMDPVWHTESLGRWCARFTAATDDALGVVEQWYRTRLMQASEIDLARDERYEAYPQLSGIKLVLGVDYVALYRLPNQPTVIELHRCH